MGSRTEAQGISSPSRISTAGTIRPWLYIVCQDVSGTACFICHCICSRSTTSTSCRDVLRATTTCLSSCQERAPAACSRPVASSTTRASSNWSVNNITASRAATGLWRWSNDSSSSPWSTAGLSSPGNGPSAAGSSRISSSAATISSNYCVNCRATTAGLCRSEYCWSTVSSYIKDNSFNAFGKTCVTCGNQRVLSKIKVIRSTFISKV